jgi:hypothetical protein
VNRVPSNARRTNTHGWTRRVANSATTPSATCAESAPGCEGSGLCKRHSPFRVGGLSGAHTQGSAPRATLG